MSIETRLRNIERRIPTRGCPACGAGASGPCKFTFADPDAPPERCPVCGTVPIVFCPNIGDRELREELPLE